jgi:lipopolysaccharide transport system permease protein
MLPSDGMRIDAMASAGERQVRRERLTEEVEVSARVGALRSLAQAFRFRELLWALTVREVKVRYSQTLLGVVWAIAQPISLMLAFWLFFGRLAKVPSDGLPYPLFYYAGLLPWTFFTTSLAFGVPSLVTNTTLLTRVYFPRELLPVANVLSASVDLAAAALVYICLMAFYHVPPGSAFLYLPFVLVVQLVLTIGVTLGLAALNVSYRDVRYALPLVSQLWLYATPVIYPLSVVPPRIRGIYLAVNPMAAVVESYRRILVSGQSPDGEMLLLAAVAAVAFAAAGYAYFKRAERHFSDVI